MPSTSECSTAIGARLAGVGKVQRRMNARAKTGGRGRHGTNHRRPGLRIATRRRPVYGRAGVVGQGFGAKVAKDLRIAVDIGGTFTDVVLEEGARRLTRKLLTTPQRPGRGGSRRRAADPGRRRASASATSTVFVHGTTLATNAVIERTRRAHGADRHRGLPRHARYRQREPLRPVRPHHREAAAAGAARAALHRARAHRRARQGAAGRSTRRPCGAVAAELERAGHRKRRRGVHARLCQPGA